MRPKVNSNRFEISNRFEMLFHLHGNLHGDFTVEISRPKLNLHQSEFHSARIDVNADNEVTSHRSEISNRFEFTSGLI